jgi:hypothetical protein
MALAMSAILDVFLQCALSRMGIDFCILESVGHGYFDHRIIIAEVTLPVLGGALS